jgi:hypothetical protein
MKKIFAIALAVVLLTGMIGGGLAFAGDSQPASKTTAAVSDISIISAGGPSSSTVLANVIKLTGNKKDLLVDVSLETGLYTETVVKTKNAERETSTATATVEVMVKATKVVDYDEDGNPILSENAEDMHIAEPDHNGGWVIFDHRVQALTAVLQGIITEITCDETGCWIDPADLTLEEIGLLLNTMSAHSFNFILMDLPIGTYYVEVIAQVSDSTSVVHVDSEGNPLPPEGSAVANASIGLGSVTIETARMIKNEVIEYVQPE